MLHRATNPDPTRTRPGVRPILAVAVVLALAAAACGDTTPNTDQSSDATGENSPTSAREVTIAAADIAFDTTELDAAVGETLAISYDNRDDRVPHNLHVEGGADGPVSTAIEEGPTTQSLEVTFTKAGEFEYFCEVHPQQMRGTITVAP